MDCEGCGAPLVTHRRDCEYCRRPVKRREVIRDYNTDTYIMPRELADDLLHMQAGRYDMGWTDARAMYNPLQSQQAAVDAYNRAAQNVYGQPGAAYNAALGGGILGGLRRWW